MKFPKFPVYSKIICTAIITSYVTHKYTEKQTKKASETWIDINENRTQEINLVCPAKERFIITGNWKMNTNRKKADQILRMLRCADFGRNQVVIGVPAPYLDYIQQRKSRAIEVGAQNIYKEAKGIFTGENSVEMLKDLGINWVILGAAERKVFFHEDAKLIGEKAKIALEKKLKVIICVGETEDERKCKKHIDAICKQLNAVLHHVEEEKWRNIVIAYEPLWMVTSQREFSADEAAEVHKAIRVWLQENLDISIATKVRIQYGGPMTATFAKDLANTGDIDGFYIGSPASLKQDFIDIGRSNLKNG